MRWSRVIVFLVILTLILGACGPALPIDADDTTESGRRFLLSVPRLQITFDEQGRPSLGPLGAERIEQLAGMQPGSLVLDPATVELMTDAGIQHLELVHTDDGVFVYANGQPLPNITWDGEMLSNAGQITGLFGLPYAKLIDNLVPLLTRTGLNVVLEFPAQAGAAVIPVREGAVLPDMPAVTDEPIAAAVVLDLDYAEDGTLSLAGIDARELASLLNLDPSAFSLPPKSRAFFEENGIEELRFHSRPAGVFVTVNGMALPHLSWSDDTLGASTEIAGEAFADTPLVKIIDFLVPNMNKANVDVVVRFAAD
ncbi:MAG: hypothetical protein U9R25_02565 [Chloroflexota bacterium]|nr:hypothetical protein [Chloroflexota bacterium]